MKNTAIAVSLALVLTGLAMPAMAHHIRGDGSPPAVAVLPCGTARTSHEWCLSNGALIICEDDNMLGAPPQVVNPGKGGLCYMSAGRGSPTCTSLDAFGRSDGYGYYSPSPTVGGEIPNIACPLTPASGTYIAFAMTDLSPVAGQASDVEWTGEGCTVPVGMRLHVEELFLFWTGGHVSGLPVPGGITEGTYVVSAGVAGSGCGAGMHVAP